MKRPSLQHLWRSLLGLRHAIDGKIEEPARVQPTGRWGGHTLHPTITRHELGAPIIAADDTLSVYYGLGWSMARDRFFQMDLTRRLAYGRFSEWLGDIPLPKEAQLFQAKRLSDIDLFLASFRFGEEALRQAGELQGVVKDELHVFVQGINDYLDHAESLPPEYLLLGKPKAWTLQDTLALSMSAGLLLDIASLDHEFLVNGLLNAQQGDLAAAIYRTPDFNVKGAAHVSPFSTRPFMARTFSNGGGGSNAWAISGERSASGKPILASDPHLPLSPIPTFWYHAILRSPDLQVSGLSFAGTPSFAIGHNGHAAWGATASQRDAFDISRVLLTKDKTRWMSAEGWKPVETHQITIPRRFLRPRVEEIHTCPLGTLFSEWRAWDDTSIALRMAGARHTDDMESGGSAQRWFTGMRTILRSRSWKEHREGLRDMNCGNLGIHHIYADMDGTIAHQTYGLHPRRSDDQGVIPRASWHDGAAWEGYLSLDELPHSVNPERGYVLSANAEPEREIGGSWPYIAAVFEPPWRFETLQKVLEQNTKADVELFRRMQLLTFSAPAPAMRDRIVREVTPRNDRDRLALHLLSAWDGCYDERSGSAALFEHVLRRGAVLFWAALLGERSGARYSLSRMSTRRFLELTLDPKDPLHPHLITKRVSLPRILQRAFEESMDSMTRRQGKDPSAWRLGKAQNVKLVHPFGAAPGIGKLFDIGSFPIEGNEYAPQAQSAAVQGDELAVMIGPVSRFICDLADPERGHWAQSSGASGRPGSSFYASTTVGWLKGLLYEAKLRG